MNRLYKHLEDKNFWYTKYLACTEAYIQALHHAPDIALGELELFYGNRESLLKILDGLDAKVHEEVKLIEKHGTELSTEQHTKVRHFLREKDGIVNRIIDLDKILMNEIEALKIKSEEKLKLLAKGKRALAKYKSSSGTNERIDKRV